MMKLALDRDQRMQHIEWHIANSEAGMVIEVAGWKLASTHGDVFGRQSGNPETKAWNWFKGQAAGRDPIGEADVLITHHYHHEQSSDWGACLWLQTPAQDAALSEYFRQATGKYSLPGVLSGVMTRESRWVEKAIL